MFRDLKRSLGDDIFSRRTANASAYSNLNNIDPKYNNIIVLDELMDLTVDSQIISKLFTQGRQRNASMILLLQNAFPKGKHSTSISRNAQYIALFRCPTDRRQIGIMAERIFNKKNRYSCQFTMMLRLNLILTLWLIIKPIHPFIDKLSVLSLVRACHVARNFRIQDNRTTVS